MASVAAGIGASLPIILMARIENWPHVVQVDEEFDCNFIAAMRNKDRKVIVSEPPAELKSGSGEIRNWVALAGAIWE